MALTDRACRYEISISSLLTKTPSKIVSDTILIVYELKAYVTDSQ